MASVETLTALRERVFAATGPDYGIDRDLTRYFRACEPENPAFDTIRDLTASIDAALGLVGRMLPDATWVVSKQIGSWVFADGGCDLLKGSHSLAATPPLAILAALLSALIAKETGDGKAA